MRKAKWFSLNELRRNAATYGSCCEFLEYDGAGYKLYNDKVMALMSYYNQQRLAEYKLAPPCYSFKRVNDKINGFITELARPVPEYNYEIIKKLRKEVELIGGSFDDCIMENIGYYEGKYVVIDAGEYMFEDITKKVENDVLGSLN